jgi:hypothetical protein
LKKKINETSGKVLSRTQRKFLIVEMGYSDLPLINVTDVKKLFTSPLPVNLGFVIPVLSHNQIYGQISYFIDYQTNYFINMSFLPFQKNFVFFSKIIVMHYLIFLILLLMRLCSFSKKEN